MLIMPNVWIDKGAENALLEVVLKYKEKTGIVITRSQAVSVLYAAWIMPASAEKVPIHIGADKQ